MTTLPSGIAGLPSFPPVPVVPGSRTSAEIKPQGGERTEVPVISGLPPKPSNTRYQTLDLWRGAACLMLLLYHSTFYADLTFRVSQPETWSLAGLPLAMLRKCWVGVPVFFVISGYCIAASIDSLRRRPHSLRDYFIRRVRRIYPPLWIGYGLAVAFWVAVSAIPLVAMSCKQLPQLSALSTWSWLGNLAAAEAWRPMVVGGGESQYLMANTWTLCYEEQFYFVTGILLAFAARRFFLAAALTTAGVLVVRHVLIWNGWTKEGFFWDGHWIMFAGGILVYHALSYQTARQRWGTVAVCLAAFVYGAAQRLGCTDPAQKHMGEYFAVAALFAIAVMVLRRWDAPIAQHWLLRPFVWSGQRSYSIYLTHYPLVVVVSSVLAFGGLTSEFEVAVIVVPLCVALSIPVAILFYETVERRFLNAKA